MNRKIEIGLIILQFYLLPRHWQESWKKILNKDLWLLGSIWLIISLVEFFYGVNSPIPTGPNIFLIIFVCTTILSILSTLPPISFSEVIKDKDIKIKVIIGSIFNQKGDMVIPSNSTFDTTLKNDFTSPLSIQGQLFQREYDNIEHLDQEIESQLTNIKPTQTNNRTQSKNKQYDIGTIIKLSHRSNFKSYWVALADVNEHGKPNGKFENLQISLESLWKYIGEKGHMTSLLLPAIGSGRTGINETRLTILKEIIFSFVAFAKEKIITKELVICLHPSDIKDNRLDVYQLLKYLKFQCEYRYEPLKRSLSSTEIN